MGQIFAAFVTHDPFFLFGVRALIGRDRTTQIHSMTHSLNALKSAVQNNPTKKLDVVVFDLDTLGNEAFYEELSHFAQTMPKVKILYLAENALKYALPYLSDLPVHGLIAKSDLGFCLHLALHMLQETNWIWGSQKSESLLYQAFLPQNCKIIKPEKRHPQLKPRVAEVLILRVFVGLDNEDIANELSLSIYTVRDYIAEGYQVLEVRNELEAFEKLSEWWRDERFS
jgi:DNA-binding NarL/FixJ family response regulator